MNTSTLPCVGNAGVYDALFEDVPDKQRQAARTKAASLCARCPAPCPEKVTADTATRVIELLPSGWMPGSREGRPEPEQPQFGGRRRRETAAGIGHDYVAPDKRVQAWVRMAAERDSQGWKLPDIALDLCVSEETVQHLLALPTQGRAA